MPKRKFSVEQITWMLRETEAELDQGKSIEWTFRKLEIILPTYYR